MLCRRTAGSTNSPGYCDIDINGNDFDAGDNPDYYDKKCNDDDDDDDDESNGNNDNDDDDDDKGTKGGAGLVRQYSAQYRPGQASVQQRKLFRPQLVKPLSAAAAKTNFCDRWQKSKGRGWKL